MINTLDTSDDSMFNVPEMPSGLPADETGTAPSEPPPKKVKKVRMARRPMKPPLRSSRARSVKPIVRYESDGTKDDDLNWTDIERQQLLGALKQHGSSDMQKLAQAVPTRSVAAISHFLLERRRKKDRAVVQGAAGKRATQAVRILRRAIDMTRRRHDRSQWLAQVVASCQREASSETIYDGPDVPHFENVYQMLHDVMEDKVPAALHPCEQYVVRRALGFLTKLVKSIDLNKERAVLSERIAWAAALPAVNSTMDSAEKPRTKADKNYSPTFPSMSTRKENLMASWNPLRLPPEIIQNSRDFTATLLEHNVSRSVRSSDLEEFAAETNHMMLT